MAMRRDGKIARRIGTRPSALHLINLPVLKEVWQNCFVFDVVTFKLGEVSQSWFALDLATFIF